MILKYQMKTNTQPDIIHIGVIVGSHSPLVDLTFQKIRERWRTCKVVCVSLFPRFLTPASIRHHADVFTVFHLSKIDDILFYLKEHSISTLLFVGNVSLKYLLKYKQTNLLHEKIIGTDKQHTSIFSRLKKYLQKFDLQIMPLIQLICPKEPHYGFLTHENPLSLEEEKNLAFGIKFIKKYSQLSIGQSIAINNQSVVAVEAMEGTDQCIIRAGKISKRNMIIKSICSIYDAEFDTPIIGYKTIKTMVKAKASILVLDPSQVIFIEQMKSIAFADKHHISIINHKISDV